MLVRIFAKDRKRNVPFQAFYPQKCENSHHMSITIIIPATSYIENSITALEMTLIEALIRFILEIKATVNSELVCERVGYRGTAGATTVTAGGFSTKYNSPDIDLEENSSMI